MKNAQLSKKIGYYSAMATSLLVAGDLQAQVAYVDIDPDENMGGYWEPDYLEIDFNTDGNIDITLNQIVWWDIYCDSSTYGITCEGSTSQFLFATADSAEVIRSITGITSYGVEMSQPLIIGDTISFVGPYTSSGFARLISNGGTWHNHYSDFGVWGYVDWDFQTGLWQFQNHKYLGVKFLIDGLTHFGWIEISTIETDDISQSVIIHSYAYETTPELPIIAGFIPTCYPPNPLTPVAITGTTAKIKWEVIAGADHYELQYRQTGAATWITKTVAGIKSFRKVAGLTCDSEYEWRIRSFCSDGEISLYSDIQTFNTNTCRLGEESLDEEPPFSIFSYGNQIHISLDEETPTNWNCKIFNVYGQLLFESQISNSETVLETELPNGIYIVTMEIAGKNYAVQVALNR